MLRELNRAFIRLAFPVQSDALTSLADSPEEHDALLMLRSLTTPALMHARGARTDIERPFLYPAPSRFSNGTFGVLYAATTIATAVRETAFHLAQVYTDGNAPAMQTRRKEIRMRVKAHCRDIRRASDRKTPAGVYDPDSYAISQRFGERVRKQASGIYYDSVRNMRGGSCIAAFTPSVVSEARLTREMTLVWNGKRFIEEHVINPL